MDAGVEFLRLRAQGLGIRDRHLSHCDLGLCVRKLGPGGITGRLGSAHLFRSGSRTKHGQACLSHPDGCLRL